MRLLATYELPFPPSVNAYWGVNNRGNTYLKKNARSFRENAIAAIWSQAGCKPKAIKCRVRLEIDLYPPDKNDRDVDNFDGKAIFDALTHAGVLKDDCQVRERTGRMHDADGGSGRAVVQVFEL